MGFLWKQEKSKKVLRTVKTLLFLISMLFSFLLFSAPVLFIFGDSLFPCALFSASLSPSLSLTSSVSSLLRYYDFRYSTVDIPLISLLRSAIITIVYGLCDGPRLSHGPYLSITTACSLMSLVFVSMKASYVFGVPKDGYVRGMEVALFICSVAMGICHVVAAYRISCRERRKLVVYKIDIEAYIITPPIGGFEGFLQKNFQGTTRQRQRSDSYSSTVEE